MLARQVAELTEALSRAQDSSASAAADTGESAPKPDVPRSKLQEREPAAAGSLMPDLWADGDGRVPASIDTSVRVPRAPKALAAAFIQRPCAASADSRRLILVATADKRVSVYAAVHSSTSVPPASSPPLASSTATSPILTFSEAWIARDDSAARVLIVAGHMDGSVSMWSISDANPPGTSGVLVLCCAASAPSAHSKFAIRVVAQPGSFTPADALASPDRDWAAAGPLILSASTDGTAAVWRPEMSAQHAPAGSSEPSEPSEPRFSLRRLQLLALPGPVTAAVWRPVIYQAPRLASAPGSASAAGAGTGLWPSFALAVSRSPYLWYCSVVGGAAAPRALVLRRVPLSDDGPAVELPHDDDADIDEHRPDERAIAAASATAAATGEASGSGESSSTGEGERPAWSRLLLASAGAGSGAGYGSAPLSRTPITLPSIIPILPAPVEGSVGAASAAAAGAEGGAGTAAVLVPQHPPAVTSASSVHLAPAAVRAEADASGSATSASPASSASAVSMALPDVLPVGWDVMDMDAADVIAEGPATGLKAEAEAASRGYKSRLTLLALATSTGLVLVLPWGSNRALRTLAGHTRHISPTFSGGGGPASSGGGGTSDLAASLRVQWYPRAATFPSRSRDAAHVQPQYLLASSDAGDGVAVLALASQRPVATIGGAGSDDAPASAGSSGGSGAASTGTTGSAAAAASQHRTTLRQLHVLSEAGTGESLLLTLDNSGNVLLRRCR